MSKFKVIAQQTPFAHTSPMVLICDQGCTSDAYIEAYKLLTAKGYNAVSKITEGEASALGVNKQYLEETLPAEFWTTNMVHIRNIQEVAF